MKSARGRALRVRAPGPPAGLWARLAVVLFAMLLPGMQTAQAMELYFARAIGQEYLPESQPPGGLPQESGGSNSSPELPALGDGARQEPPKPMSTWSKVLIGVVLVAAVAALGDSGGASAQMTVTPGAAPDGGAPPDGGGGSSDGGPASGDSGGGGGIDVGIGDDGIGVDFDDDDDDRGRGRGRGRGRDRD